MSDETTELKAAVEGDQGILVIRGAGTTRAWNGIRYKTGLSAKNVGATKLSMNVATIPPGSVAYAHVHVDFEVMLYILEGHVRHEYGPDLSLTTGLGVRGTVTAGNAILFGSFGLTLGDIGTGLFSQWLGSRKRAIAISLVAGYSLMLMYYFVTGLSSSTIYLLSFVIGTTVGYWAVLVTMPPSNLARTFARRSQPRFRTSSAAQRCSLRVFLRT